MHRKAEKKIFKFKIEL